jgi:hypothetical protein
VYCSAKTNDIKFVMSWRVSVYDGASTNVRSFLWLKLSQECDAKLQLSRRHGGKKMACNKNNQYHQSTRDYSILNCPRILACLYSLSSTKKKLCSVFQDEAICIVDTKHGRLSCILRGEFFKAGPEMSGSSL